MSAPMVDCASTLLANIVRVAAGVDQVRVLRFKWPSVRCGAQPESVVRRVDPLERRNLPA
jgi:hypothetical protein